MPKNPQLLFVQIDARLSIDPCLTLQGLARALGVDRHAIERSVRETRGIPFREIQKQKRFIAARELSEMRSDLEIKEIAARLGYSPNAFCRFIRTLTGKTPSQYRTGLNCHK
jgi:AraC-like DNA-binding protein